MKNKVSWKEFEKQAPRLASLGFEKLNRKVAYLALLNKDGTLRLHTVTPFIGNGMLFMFTEPSSPKIRYLRRDGRYALYCSVDGKEGEPLIEFLVSSIAQVVTDASIRQQVEKIAASSVVIDTRRLFELRINYILVAKYDKEGKRMVQRWNLNSLQQDCQTINNDGCV